MGRSLAATVGRFQNLKNPRGAPMKDLLSIIGFTGLCLFGLVMIARYLEKRAINKGSLFTQPPTIGMRIFAILLIIFFGAAMVMEIATQEEVHIAFILITLGLILYVIGLPKLIAEISKATSNRDDSNEKEK